MWRRGEKRKTGFLKRFWKSRSGMTAIEFAFVGGPFLYLFAVIFETGIMLFSEYVIENGVANAARMIRTGQVQAQGMTAGQFKDTVCGKLASFLDCGANLHIDVRRFTAFSDISMPPPIKDGELTKDVTDDSSFQPGQPMEVVVVRAYYDWKLFVPGMSALSNLNGGRRLLTAGAAFRNEPFGSTS
jgi:Flp pilus assembly protein TadG